MIFNNLSNNGEENYLALLKYVLEKGQAKANRTGDIALTVPTVQLYHNFTEGFPLFTTKQMAKKAMLVELEGFIGGITDKKWYQERGCRIWDEWCNPTLVPPELYNDERKTFQKTENDLGPVYGYQWRRFNGGYNRPTPINKKLKAMWDSPEHALTWGDQFDYVIQTLKTNPDDRRMKVSAWNVLAKPTQALPPCHTDFTIVHINGTLHMNWSQRSCDLLLGIPFNLASYAMLLELLCKETGMQPGTISGCLADVHIYTHHIDACLEQLERIPKNLPTINFNKWDGIYNWEHKDVDFVGYEPHGKLTKDTRVSI